MLSSCTRIGISFYYGAAACTTFGFILMYDAWRVALIRFNNVSVCPSIFIPNISGLLRRPRVLNMGRRLS